MKQVLILGDSISMGYRELVKEQLKGKAEVSYFEENGRFSAYTLWLANQWIRTNGVPDIVHWNNGIWDITVEEPLNGNFTPLEEYAAHLRRMIQMLKRAGVPHIIFATTTYQHPDRKESSAEDVSRFNSCAVEIMKQEDVAVNDLGELVRQNLYDFICEDHLHLNEKGYQACAKQAAELIAAYL